MHIVKPQLKKRWPLVACCVLAGASPLVGMFPLTEKEIDAELKTLEKDFYTLATQAK